MIKNCMNPSKHYTNRDASRLSNIVRQTINTTQTDMPVIKSCCRSGKHFSSRDSNSLKTYWTPCKHYTNRDACGFSKIIGHPATLHKQRCL